MRVAVTVRIPLDMASDDEREATYAAEELVRHVIGGEFAPILITEVEALT